MSDAYKADSDEFLKAVAAAMETAGLDVEFKFGQLVVQGCKFDAERGRKLNRIKFLGSGFKVSDDGSFDVAKAIGLVMAELPRRIQAKAAQDAYTEHAVAVRRELAPNARRVTVENERWHIEWYQLDERTFVRPTNEGVEVLLRCKSTEEVKETLEKLALEAID